MPMTTDCATSCDWIGVFSALLFGPLFGPLLLAGMLQLMIKRSDVGADQPVTLAVAHAERAPNLLSWLEQNRITVQRIVTDDAGAREAVRTRARSVVLDIPADYGSRLASGEPAALLLYQDGSDAIADRSIGRVRAALLTFQCAARNCSSSNAASREPADGSAATTWPTTVVCWPTPVSGAGAAPKRGGVPCPATRSCLGRNSGPIQGSLRLVRSSISVLSNIG